MNEIEKFDKHATEVDNSLSRPRVEEDYLTIEQVVKFFENDDYDFKTSLQKGLVFQTNKELKIVDLFFKELLQEIDSIKSKNNRDLDMSFFNINKKVLSSNLSNIKQIFKHYNIDDKKIIGFLIGTLIQYTYESKRTKN